MDTLEARAEGSRGSTPWLSMSPSRLAGMCSAGLKKGLHLWRSKAVVKKSMSMAWPRWQVVADACSVTSVSRATAVGSSMLRSRWIRLYGLEGLEGRCRAHLVAEVSVV